MSCIITLHKTGVYEILNTITKERYIGSASRIGKSNSLSGFYVRFDKLKITKLNKKNPYKRTEQGLIDNREKRRNHPHIAKLDSEKVKDIKIMLKNKETMKTCANKYNVHIGTIQAIKSGLTWFDIKID